MELSALCLGNAPGAGALLRKPACLGGRGFASLSTKGGMSPLGLANGLLVLHVKTILLRLFHLFV